MFDQPAGIIEHLCVFEFFLVVLKNAFIDRCCLQLCNCARMVGNCVVHVALKIDEYYIQCGCTMDTKQVYFEWHCDWSFINLLFERVKTPQL